MKQRKLHSLLIVTLTCVFALSTFMGCSSLIGGKPTDFDAVSSTDTYIKEAVNKQPFDIVNGNGDAPTGAINYGVVLVKKEKDFSYSLLSSIDYNTVEPLYVGSSWYKIELSDGVDTVDTVKNLRKSNFFDKVDYDYIMEGDGEIESIDISGNDYEPNPGYFKPMEVQEGWKSLTKDGKQAGGSPDVIVAVIDTGVDYNHVDLRNNIWKNSGEIPDNGIDDDGNGYIDDVYGWDFVGNDKDPMDDNGHGTHVAGIVAAENNKIGTVGIAYNCKVMCLKAGTSSGSFNNSDIAEAIRYAYMNGASVINMSFGGTGISLAVEEALEDAYNQCVLVAAAGNDGMCNQPDCIEHYPLVEVIYPAALTYVIGVMSCDSNGTSQSSFSNFDHYLYNTYEYDVYAPGEQISSTFPNNKYAKLSGTSMACPNVAGIAALVRSYFSDRDMYSTKFITAQIVRGGGNYICASVYSALNELPTPKIYSVYDYYIFDNVEFDEMHNNGNGIIEAGETIHLGFELMNRGGKASDVNVSVNTKRLADDITDPYIHILSNDISYDEIGTYSIRDGGKIYDDDEKLIDIQNPIVIKIDENTPNDYYSVINFVITYKNGLDNKDKTEYSGEGEVSLSVTNGYVLPDVIAEDTVFTANRRYIVVHDVTIPAGVTVTFEEGCDIQFYANPQDKIVDTIYNTPTIYVYGNLYFIGTEDNLINVHPSEMYWDYAIIFYLNDSGVLKFEFCNIVNMCCNGDPWNLQNIYYYKSNIILDKSKNTQKKQIRNAQCLDCVESLFVGTADSCYMDFRRNYISHIYYFEIKNSVIECGNDYGGGLVNYGSCDTTTTNNLIVFTDERPYSSRGAVNFSASDHATSEIINNSFITSYHLDSVSQLLQFVFSKGYSGEFISQGNVFDQSIIDCFPYISTGYIQQDGTPVMDLNDTLNHDDSLIWPYIKNIELFNKDGEKIRTVGSGKVTAKVTFNRQMDKSKDFKLYYGSVEPYRDYVINGGFAEDGLTWTGEFQVKATIEGGINYFSAGDGCAADDSFKTLVNNAPAFTFDIDMTQAMSMNLLANDSEDGIELTWVQDDYDTLMGYNVYRSNEKDGYYVKLNTSIIPAGENTFLDDNAEPGELYWYTFTVVLSDFTESKPAGKVSCRSTDTIKPTVYHTPVNQGYTNNNLVISCTASDNIGISTVTLYYRVKGATEWKTLTMGKQSDKYSATVFGSEITMDGLEYYIVASDGRNQVNKGTADEPYSVVVKDASMLSTYGDVDGDGVVTTKDALMIIRAINGDLILSDDEFKRADLNKDNVLSSVEALRILQYINGKVTTLEM